MKTLLSSLLAAGLAFGVNSALAQNTKSDEAKAQGQERAQGDKDCSGMTGSKLELCLKHGREMSESQPDQGPGARRQTGQTQTDQRPAGQNPVGQGEGTKTTGSQGTQSGPEEAAANSQPGMQSEGTTTTPGSQGTQAGPRDDAAAGSTSDQKKRKAE